MTAVDVKPSNVGIVDLAVPQRCSYSRTWRCLKKTSGLSFCQQPSFFNKVEPSECCSKIAGLSDLFLSATGAAGSETLLSLSYSKVNPKHEVCHSMLVGLPDVPMS